MSCPMVHVAKRARNRNSSGSTNPAMDNHNLAISSINWWPARHFWLLWSMIWAGTLYSRKAVPKKTMAAVPRSLNVTFIVNDGSNRTRADAGRAGAFPTAPIDEFFSQQIQQTFSLASNVSSVLSCEQYRLRNPLHKHQKFRQPQQKPAKIPHDPRSSLMSNDASRLVSRSQILMRVYTRAKSPNSIQNAPSSASTKPTCLAMLGYFFHFLDLSDQSPFHSYVPHGLRNCTNLKVLPLGLGTPATVFSDTSTAAIKLYA
mmetsp:Transcript_6780/g.18948  ORF Transcript_6780/g.18948 Transcript_6780/m.18948 type:complete len:259 (-) Transcript_6780:310-1086(-)